LSSALFQIQKIKQLSIPVHDLDVAVAFYQEKLGLPLLFRVPNMAFLDCDGIRILLSVPEIKQFDHPSSIVYFRKSLEVLPGTLVNPLRPPHGTIGQVGFQPAFRNQILQISPSGRAACANRTGDLLCR
jgi:catechol 2,3-dioxygenase-like lactoylglutathione lyase family enzyme